MIIEVIELHKSELIVHPVRFRIMRAIGKEQVTTQEIADKLSDVPKSSIYRHLKLLLDGDMVKVADTRLVNGIQEKLYQLAQRPYLAASDVENLSPDEHLELFTTYAMTLLQGYAAYVAATSADDGKVDMVADRTGFTEVEFYATLAEFDQLQLDINTAVLKLINNPPGNGRRKHKLSFVTHPVDE